MDQAKDQFMSGGHIGRGFESVGSSAFPALNKKTGGVDAYGPDRSMVDDGFIDWQRRAAAARKDSRKLPP